MIPRTSLEGFGEREGLAVLTFVTGETFQLIPEWQNESVRRILAVQLLAEKNQVIAQVVSGAFWTDGAVDQFELGSYCALAIDLEREAYRHYRTGKIAQEEWEARFRSYWQVVVKSRQIATALAKGQLPVAPKQSDMDRS